MIRLPWTLARRSRLERDRERWREERIRHEQEVEELLFRVARAYDDRDKAVAGAKAANERADAAYRDCGKLISDLRAVTFHVNERTNPHDQRITAVLEIRSEMLFHAFRFDATFRHALAYELERLIMADPQLRTSVLDWPRESR